MEKRASDAPRWQNPSHVSTDAGSALARTLLGGDRLRQAVHHNGALGTFLIELPCPGAIAAIALAGFDFVVLDMEHSTIGFQELERLILAAHAAELTVLVRPWAEDLGLVSKVLDMGAHGVMVPHVDTPERAAMVVDRCRFAPDGARGFSPLSRFDAMQDPLAELSRSAFVVLQIEGVDGLKRVAEISAVPGVDAVFVGPYDLALSLGVSPMSEEVFTAAQDVARRADPSASLGIYVDDVAMCGDWARRNFKLQCVSFDGRMLADAARHVADNARAGLLAPDTEREKE